MTMNMDWRAEYEGAIAERNALIVRVEAAEKDAAECRAERARYGDIMTSLLSTAEADAARWRTLHADRDRDLRHEYARANEAEAEVARLREELADFQRERTRNADAAARAINELAADSGQDAAGG